MRIPKVLPFWLFAFVAVTTMAFQNCGPGFSGSSNMTANLASQAPQAVATPVPLFDVHDQSHQDRPAGSALQDRERTTTSQDVIGDRRFVRAMFRDVFGDEVLVLGNSIPLGVIANLGGNCSVYERYMVVNATGRLVDADTASACVYLDTAAWMNGAMQPKFTVTRAGLLSRACEGAVMNRVTFPIALSKIGPRLGPSAMPEVNTENLKNLALLFYRNHGDPPVSVVESLRVLFTPAAATPDEWRAAIFTICVSSHWQNI
jgi:hypothetical protein